MILVNRPRLDGIRRRDMGGAGRRGALVAAAAAALLAACTQLPPPATSVRFAMEGGSTACHLLTAPSLPDREVERARQLAAIVLPECDFAAAGPDRYLVSVSTTRAPLQLGINPGDAPASPAAGRARGFRYTLQVRVVAVAGQALVAEATVTDYARHPLRPEREDALFGAQAQRAASRRQADRVQGQ